ncbi:MAG TPA: hypothetical protein VNI20_08830 [Fimbriimonadaceae bacterium]|nr:hypothetical protein [Fimbriimonadaceae bacterium]
MIATLACFALVGPKLTFVEPKIVGMTAFRNGYGFVLKEIDLPASEEVYVREPQGATEGTLWFAPAKNTHVSEVTLTYIDDESIKRDAGTLSDLLYLNVGNEVEVSVMQPGVKEMYPVRGLLRSMSAQMLTMEVKGRLQTIPRNWVQAVSLDPATANTQFETKVRTPVLRIRTTDNTPGKVYVVGLIKGLPWSPAYYIDVSDPRRAKLTMRATVMNGIGDFKGIDLGMVSGFPVVSRLGSEDPLTNAARRIFTLAQSYTPPPTLFPESSPGPMFGAGGGAGMGGAGFGPGAIQGVPYDASDTTLTTREKDKARLELGFQATASEHNELFVYAIKGVSMNLADRSYFVIQETEADYDFVYTADTGTMSGDTTVLRSLVLPNKTTLPWTDAPAMIVHQGELVGQAPMPYTVVGDDAEILLGRTTIVHATSDSKEIGRVSHAREEKNVVYDLIQFQDTVTLTNFGKEPATVRVSRQTNGKATKVSDGGTADSMPVNNDSLNSNSSVKWEVTVKPGEKKTLQVEYEKYVRVY